MQNSTSKTELLSRREKTMDREKSKNPNRPNGPSWRSNRWKDNDSSSNHGGEPVIGSNGERNLDRRQNHNQNRNQDRSQNSNRNRNQNENNNKFEAKHPISYRTLKDVLNMENDSEFILKLSSKKNGFPLLLDQPSIPPDGMCVILAALAKASKSSTEMSMIQLLVHFYMEINPKLCGNSNFGRELKLFIADLNNYFARFASNRQKYVDAIEDLLTFLHRLQSTIYIKSFDAVRNLMELITAQIEFINRKGNTLTEYIVDTVKQLNESVQNVKGMREKTEKLEILMEPPDNFREIGIYPNTLDILCDHDPFIRKNIIEGKYVAGVEQYLDIQYRLMREDFMRSLRNAITQYRLIKNKEKELTAKKFRIDDVNIYQNVEITGSEMQHNDPVHNCRFDITPFKNFRWQYNKRLMSGSLVCFSSDDFETFFFATVAGLRDPIKLTKGEFKIKLEIESAAMPEITSLTNYVMVESHVYFEAYRHNLTVLQGFNKDNFPLERYIVNVEKEILPPSYLIDNSNYLIPNGLPVEHPEAKKMLVNVLSNNEWPSSEDFLLDESQYAAFRAALTKQMVVIQGPPGTGKTYIGLRIVEVLLANTTQWPILIVCYTNHALDQFLEGILKFCQLKDNELVRIGGKSQCEALEAYNLANIKKDMKARRQVPEFIYKSRSESNHKLKNIQEKISCLENEIENLTKTVLGFELESVIRKLNRRHCQQLFTMAHGRSLSEGILNWLGYAVREEVDQQEVNDYNGNPNYDYIADPEIQITTFENFEVDEEEVRELEEQRHIGGSSDEDDDTDHRNRVQNHGRKRFDGFINMNNVVPTGYADAEGFEVPMEQRKRLKRKIRYEIKKEETMPEDRAKAVGDINALLPNDRWNLYRLWIKLYVEDFKQKIHGLRDAHRTECLRSNGLRKQEDIEIVKNAKIIGMTTTGAAKYRHIVDGTKPTITIVEEAAEVLEAHIVTALCQRTDHLILIGDHLQLRPNPAVYELAKKFNLEISLFERFIKNKMEYFQLKQQHRMRPCISSLLVPHIYKQLLDHPSVEKYEDVKGISKNMFFVTHRKNEITMQETRSHLNVYEAEFIVELCRYVVLQGYETSQVTILTTYSGQLHHIRQLMCAHLILDGVRATVVDNYQGEECDIILLSFVRSNEEGNIGFLKDSHRVNVALSRAKKGLYCIGDFSCLAEKSSLWQNLLTDLTAQEAIGDELEIFCQNHTDYKTLVKSKDDFNVAPEGGCDRPCGSRLPCGHVCESACHIIDIEHVGVYNNCRKMCDQIICEREHRCPRRCHYEQKCGNCQVIVEKLRVECQHNVKIACSADPKTAYCYSSCERERSCGHKCKSRCGANCDEIICNEKVDVESPCGHTVTVKCSDAKNNSILLKACTVPCRIELKCGHLCKGSCGECKHGRLHTRCKEKCSIILICGHPCPESCSIDCPPCKQKCTNSCVHSKCTFRCGDPCPPCKERCTWRCKHLRCSKLCCEPCDRELCEHPNPSLISKCKHPSIGVCGEKKPDLCRICNKDEVEGIFLGHEDEPDARFIELYDCKHVIEVKGLLRWMKSETESSGSNSNGSIQFKECPKCKTIIRRTRALNTFTQASLRDIQQVKLKIWGDKETNRKTQSILLNRVKNIVKSFDERNEPIYLLHIYNDILSSSEIINNFPKSNQALIELNNKLQLAEQLKRICLEFRKCNESEYSQQNFSKEVIEKFKSRLRMAALFIQFYKNCEQQRDDISTEISFLQLMGDVIVKASGQPINDTGKKLLNDAFEVANKYGSATEIVRKKFQEIVTEAAKHSSGLGIPMKEKQMVLKAMGFGRGHWYKCPNGHIYAIGDCGGAMETSKCPECGATIGGQSHQLIRDNALATEMDGATAPAWPTNLQH